MPTLKIVTLVLIYFIGRIAMSAGDAKKNEDHMSGPHPILVSEQ